MSGGFQNAKLREVIIRSGGARTETLFGFFGKQREFTQLPDGTKVTIVYDTFGERIAAQTTTKPDGTTIKAVLDSFYTKLYDEVTKPDGKVFDLISDGSTRVRTLVNGKLVSDVTKRLDGAEVTTAYDANERPVTTTTVIRSADGGKSETTMDSFFKRKLREVVVQPDGTRTEMTFDFAGRKNSEITTAPNGTVTRAVFDAFGKKLHDEVTTPDGVVSIQRVAPVLLDLNGDGQIDLRAFDPIRNSGQSSPHFDWNDDGKRDATAWVDYQDGFLAIDLDEDGSFASDGRIDQVKELAFALWKTDDERRAELKELGIADSGQPVTDLEGLRHAFDTSNDNVLDSRDARWREFRVWQDLNQNGVSDPGELKTMSEAGIKLINLLPDSAGARAFSDGSVITGTSTMEMMDGSKRLVADASLSFRPSNMPIHQAVLF